MYSKENKINFKKHITWTMCRMDVQALENMYAKNIKIKQVITNQPIIRGAQYATEFILWDTIHNYIIGFTLVILSSITSP